MSLTPSLPRCSSTKCGCPGTKQPSKLGLRLPFLLLNLVWHLTQLTLKLIHLVQTLPFLHFRALSLFSIWWPLSTTSLHPLIMASFTLLKLLQINRWELMPHLLCQIIQKSNRLFLNLIFSKRKSSQKMMKAWSILAGMIFKSITRKNSKLLAEWSDQKEQTWNALSKSVRMDSIEMLIHTKSLNSDLEEKVLHLRKVQSKKNQMTLWTYVFQASTEKNMNTLVQKLRNYCSKYIKSFIIFTNTNKGNHKIGASI